MQTKTVHAYMPEQHSLYWGPVTLTWDDEKGEDCCQLAPNWVEVAPPEAAYNQKAQWDGEKWNLIHYFQWVPLYYKANGFSVPVDIIKPGMGPDDFNATEKSQPDSTYVWNEENDDWVQDPARKRAADIKQWETERTAYLNSIQRPIQLHQDESLLGLSARTISPEEHLRLVRYRVVLNTLKPLDPIPELSEFQ